MSEKFSDNGAYNLIKAGIDSGSIKLMGTALGGDAKENAVRDATYLLTLVALLQAKEPVKLPAGT